MELHLAILRFSVFPSKITSDSILNFHVFELPIFHKKNYLKSVYKSKEKRKLKRITFNVVNLLSIKVFSCLKDRKCLEI